MILLPAILQPIMSMILEAMVAWLDSNAWGLESEALGAGAVRVVGMCCNFVVEPKVGVDDRKFSSSQRTDRE